MEAIKQTVAQNMGIGDAHTLVPEDQQFDLNETPNLKGKVAVITGGSEGIGYGASHTLLSHGIEKLFILSMSQEVVDKSLKAIEEEMGAETAKKVTWLQCDLSDWKKTKEIADKIAKSTDRIDILINNAARGIMTYQLTDYGVDRHVRFISPCSIAQLTSV
jgi:NAD(P)-dependent dehydrogenase (short-subunit alcohol dehydrogenase family)